MGGFWALPRRLRRGTKPQHPFDHPTTDIRISLRRIMDSGDGIADLKNRQHAEHSSSVYFMAASGRYHDVSCAVLPLSF
jgi:hypothetical protein